MNKVNFTAERVEGFKCESGKQQTIFWDGKAPGLGMRVTASGAKSFIFEARLHGKTLRLTIGDKRTWSIGKAQAEATRLKTLTDQGIDPRQQKADQRAKAEAAQAETKRQNLTLGEVWPLYLEARKGKWSERHYQDHLNLATPGGIKKKLGSGLTIAAPLAVLMPLLLSELTGNRIAEWLESEAAKRPTNAAQSFRLLRAFIRWVADIPAYRGIISADAYSTRAVRDALPKNQAKDGDCLQREQLPAWFDAVRKIQNPVISAYLQGLLLTGARREELAGLKWTDVDFQWRSLTIRDKVEGLRIIPMTPYLAHLLACLPRRNQWVFSSLTAADGKIAEPRIAHAKALQAAGLPHVSLHGLRRSFGSLCEWVEMPAGISAQIMGHKPSALAEKHYRRRPLDLLRMWHDKIEIWILEQAGISFDAKQSNHALRAVK
ncbi:MAG: integrase family protein [Pseudomonadota bacterium]